MNETVPAERPSIRRTNLHKQLCRTAQVRSIISMAAMLPAMFLGGWMIEMHGNELLPLLAVGIVFGIPLLVSWLLTNYYCHPHVKCQFCGHSLWKCGTGNFKPRRMRVRPDATACPGCGVPIV